VSKRIAGFLDGAHRSLDIALYDLRLEEAPANTLLTAFDAAVKRGVSVRLMFNLDHPEAIIVPPPPEIDWEFRRPVEDRRCAHQAGRGRARPDAPQVRSPRSGGPAPVVLTGSSNWTNDSWNREENLILTVASEEIAADYAINFQGLWEKPVVAASGHKSSPWSSLADGTRVRPYFCPGRSLKLVHAMSRSIASAERRVRVCSPVITSGPVLGTLAEVCAAGKVDVGGVYDATQMDEVQVQWSARAAPSGRSRRFAASQRARGSARSDRHPMRRAPCTISCTRRSWS